MGSSLVVRYASMGDLEYLHSKDPGISVEDVHRMIDDRRFLVAEDNGTLVGCLRYGMFWDKIPFMNLLWVEDGFRGNGFGSALVRKWEKDVATAGSAMVMTSSQENERGQHFYRKLGYSDCGEFTLPGEPSAELLFFKEMKK